MRRLRSQPRLGSFFALVAAAALLFVGCTSNRASSGVSGPVQVYRGGTVYFAEQFGSPPDWIFPFTGGATFSTPNLNEFQYLMYRPLYWFGEVKNPFPTLDEQLSLAAVPTASNGGKTVVIRLKGWTFSNGQAVDAESVIFWMNMMMAESGNWVGSVPGEFPSNVASYSAPHGPGGDIVTITFTRRYATKWLLYNELSQITPMPEAWDITSLTGIAGSGKCGAVTTGAMNGSVTTTACTRVWTFDTDNGGASSSPQMGGDINTFDSNRLWQVVDGPWRLSSYDVSQGEVTFIPNRDYSGPQRPIISRFVERWYPSDAAVLAALARGGPGAPNVTQVLIQDLPLNNGPPGSTGANLPQLAGRFVLDPVYGSETTYAWVNFKSTGDRGVTGALFRQLYIRQTLQLLLNQPQLIKTTSRGYGVPDYGPVPLLSKSPFLSEQEAVNPYPFDPARAVLLLKSHGWAIHPEEADICMRPGTAPTDCGKGIPPYAKLSFSVLYSTGGGPAPIELAVAESSAWAKVGIQAATQGEGFSCLIGTLSGSQGSGCIAPGPWGIGIDGGGWIWDPSYMPTGDLLFSGDVSNNLGSYNDPTANRLITKSLTANGPVYLFDYENYLAEQLPVIWEPNITLTPYEVSTGLGGVAPINQFGSLTPEYWYWKTPSRS